MQPQTLQTDDATIGYLTAGSGPVLVLLHGIGSAATSWRAQIDAFAPNFRVIAWNAPGYDSSTPFPQDAPDVSDYANRLDVFLTTLGVTRAHIVGHSLGSLIAARFALEHADKVMSLTLASCAIGHAGLPAEERKRLLASRIDDVAQLGPRGMAEKRGARLLTPQASPAMVRAVVDTMAQVDPRGYAQAARMLSGGDMLGDLGRLPAPMPVQIVFGSEDVITPPAVNQRAAAARPSATVTIVPAAGHALYIEQAERFNAAVRNFVESHHDK